MSNESSETDVDVTIEKLKRKYLERRKPVLSEEKNTAGMIRKHDDPSIQRVMKSPKSKCTYREMRGYNRALRELFKAVTHPPERLESDYNQSGSEEDLSEDWVLHTETDVTLPSSLIGTLGSSETEPTVRVSRERGVRGHQSVPLDSPSEMGQVYQEMLHIYEQLRAERLSQQRWEKELQEREVSLLQQQPAISRLRGVEEEVHRCIHEAQEKHQQEVNQLQELLRERTKENKRLKASFDTIKELNDTMKKQMNDIVEHNKKLETQSRKVQARLENLQRKYEYSVAQRGRENGCPKAIESKPSKQEKTTVSSKPAKGCVSPVPLRLLALLLDWVFDGQALPPVVGDRGTVLGQCVMPAVPLHERCSKALPLLVEQLQQASGSDPTLLLSLLRFIYGALQQLDNNTQPMALSSTLRRLGEEVSKPSAQQMTPQDPSLLPRPRVPHRTLPLYRSPCPHTRLFSSLITLRTITQADVQAQVLDSLHSDLVCEDSRGLFLQYGGVSVLLGLLRRGRGGLQTPIDILLLLSSESRFLSGFLEACSSEDFFRTAALLLRNPQLELPLLEKLSILLQKLSKIRKNRRLFELCSLHLLLQEMNRTTDRTHTFLCLNLGSILLNLK